MLTCGYKSIAEYAIRKRLAESGAVMRHFTLKMEGREGTLTDENGDSITLVYDNDQKAVYEKVQAPA